MKTHSVSLIGKRSSNEDKHKIIVNLDNKDNKFANINFFGVYDGHGGKDISKYLESNYHKYFLGKYMETELANLNKSKKYFNKIHNHIQGKLENYLKNKSYKIGSTSLVSVFFKHNKKIHYYVSNLGDCRGVVCNSKNKAICLTKDHKPNADFERKRIEKLNGKIYYDGMDWRIEDLSVSRAFGDIDSKPYVSHSPDVYKYTLSNDKFMILACDGLWDVFSNQQAVNFVVNCMKNNSSIENNNTRNKNNIANLLAEEAIKKGTYDNVSIIIVFF